jgi:Fe-S oxidoreductase
MCPSSKVTRDRIHSPKGRAGILREWLRLTSESGHDAGASGRDEARGRLVRTAAPSDFSHEVYDAMAGCLACKACATQCPIHVDVPALRADFLEQYHTRYRRPLLDYFVASLERMLRFLAILPRLSNFMMNLGVSRWFLRQVGIVDSPALASRTLARGLSERRAEAFSLRKIERLDEHARKKLVFVAQDAFTTYYEPNVALATYDLLTRLGRKVYFLPYRDSGKALHIKGFVSQFRRLVQGNATFYGRIAKLGVPIVGLEPAVTLVYRDEYRHVEENLGFEVKLLQEYLASELPQLREELGDRFPRTDAVPLRLFGHCTERTFEPRSQMLWREVFQAFGADVTLEATGCCGMCGVFGHEKAHLEESRGIYAMSWEPRMLGADPGQVLATGHSCRSQVKRFSGFVPRHPAEALASALALSEDVKQLPVAAE